MERPKVPNNGFIEPVTASDESTYRCLSLALFAGVKSDELEPTGQRRLLVVDTELCGGCMQDTVVTRTTRTAGRKIATLDADLAYRAL
jgi:hypothetical protein